jgi:diguanylate cyclase (GGDEF)-like protein
VPMRRAGEHWGVVLLSRPKWQKFERGEFELVRDFAALAGKAIAEGEQHAELRQQASFDSLTGALNRGNVETLLEKGFHQAVQQRQSFSVLFIDLDNFKRVNDDYGHATGDECLIAVAQRISQTLDTSHALGRYGGEEFVVLLPQIGEPTARQLAERIRVVVSAEAVVAGEHRLNVTVSIGGASRQPGELTPRMLLERADQALYQAKRSGRNRVNWADDAAAQSA